MVPSGSQRSRKQGGFRRGCLVIITLVVSVMCLLWNDTTEVIINETQQLQTSWISSCGFYIGAGIWKDSLALWDDADAQEAIMFRDLYCTLLSQKAKPAVRIFRLIFCGFVALLWWNIPTAGGFDVKFSGRVRESQSVVLLAALKSWTSSGGCSIVIAPSSC